MTLKEQLKQEFNIDLPIAGGDGSCKENAIIIDNSFYGLHDIEYATLKYMALLRQVDWCRHKQSLMIIDGKKMDVIEMVHLEGDEEISEEIYFDLSQCK